MFERFIAWTTRLVPFDEKAIARWERVRTRGRLRYVLVHGVLFWGLPMLLVVTGFTYFQQYGWVWPSAETERILLILLNLAIWPIGGYLFGAAMWSMLEGAYKARKNE